jgi:hypothetical protein
VAAAQRALDVLWAQVVVELGLGEGAQEGALVIAGGEVEEGACDGGAAETGIEGDVAVAESGALVESHARRSRARLRHRQLNHRGTGGNDAPPPGRGRVAEEGAVARG